MPRVTDPGYHRGRIPANKGKTYPAEILTFRAEAPRRRFADRASSDIATPYDTAASGSRPTVRQAHRLMPRPAASSGRISRSVVRSQR